MNIVGDSSPAETSGCIRSRKYGVRQYLEPVGVGFSSIHECKVSPNKTLEVRLKKVVIDSILIKIGSIKHVERYTR